MSYAIQCQSHVHLDIFRSSTIPEALTTTAVVMSSYQLSRRIVHHLDTHAWQMENFQFVSDTHNAKKQALLTFVPVRTN